MTPTQIKTVWPDDKEWQRVVLLAQELIPIHRVCEGCDNSANMEIPRKDCCVFDKAHMLLNRLKELESP